MTKTRHRFELVGSTYYSNASEFVKQNGDKAGKTYEYWLCHTCLKKKPPVLHERDGKEIKRP